MKILTIISFLVILIGTNSFSQEKILNDSIFRTYNRVKMYRDSSISYSPSSRNQLVLKNDYTYSYYKISESFIPKVKEIKGKFIIKKNKVVLLSFMGLIRKRLYFKNNILYKKKCIYFTKKTIYIPSGKDFKSLPKHIKG